MKPPKTASGIKVKQFTPTSKKNSVTHSKANTDSLSAFVGAKHQYSDIYEQFSAPISKDFLQLSRQDNITKILDDNHDKTEPDKIFSDVAFEIDENKKIRRNIIVTPKYFYLVDHDEFKCLKIYKGMSKVVMTNKNPNTLVLVFQSNEGIAIEREKLLNDVWGYGFFGDDRTIDTHIKMLRNSLGKYKNCIQTIRGFGYKFEYK